MIYSFITDQDIEVAIKRYFLDQIISDATYTLKRAEAAAFSLIKSKLNSRYDLVQLFPPIKEYDKDKTYSLGEYCSKSDSIYKSKVANNTNTDPITNTDKWEPSDPRDALLVLHCANITVFYIVERINPRKISEDIIDAYNRAVDWLDDVNRMREHPDFPLITIPGGMEVKGGSNDPTQHYF